VESRRNELVIKTARELLKEFHLFESLSNRGKRRMRAIKRMFYSSDHVSQV
jgi:hypothetical protein